MRILKTAALAAAVVAGAMLAMPSGADAHRVHHYKHKHVGPHGHGLTPLQGYVTGGMFCSAGFLIFHAAYVSQTENRELTYKEAYNDVAACWLPVIGNLIVDQYVQDHY